MDVSFIIVNFNTKDFLKMCLDSIYSTVEGLEYEIIVVDNASSDGSLEMVKREYPFVILIENKENRGFAAANNQALEIMKGRYAFLINSDARLTEGAVNELFRFMESHPEAAMCCGQLLNEDGSKQRSFASFPTLFTLLANETILEFLCPRRFPGKRRRYEKPLEVDSCIGAAVMVRKQAIEEVGGLDERYFFFFEETDWACTMRKAGWKVFHVPTSFIYHFQGRSIGQALGPRFEYYRSRYKYFDKWYPRPYSQAVRVVVFARLLINWIGTSLLCLFTFGLNRQLRHRCNLYMQLIAWHLKGDTG